jgi:hypothetical protein
MIARSASGTRKQRRAAASFQNGKQRGPATGNASPPPYPLELRYDKPKPVAMECGRLLRGVSSDD